VLGDEGSVEGSRGYRSDIVEIDRCIIGQFEHDALECSRPERHPDEITCDDAHRSWNRVAKRARVVVGKVDGYFSKSHWWLRYSGIGCRMDEGNYLRHLRWVKPPTTNKRPNKNPLPVLGEGGYIRSNRQFQPGAND